VEVILIGEGKQSENIRSHIFSKKLTNFKHIMNWVHISPWLEWVSKWLLF